MPENKKSPLIIAHRGTSAFAPENTLAAFRRAIEDEADGIEFDVRISKDGVPVVFHDSTLQRMARVKERVSHLALNELQDLELGSWFNRKFPRRADDKFIGETIPTLSQTFDFLRGFQGRIYLEIKGFPRETPATVEAVIKKIQKTDLLPRVILKSFNLGAIAQAKKNLPEIRTAALFAPKVVSLLRRKYRLIEQAREYSADELSLHRSLATRKFVESASAENLPITIWTADRPIWVKRAIDFGIQAIITNNPARLIAERDKILNEEPILN
jgi:glycerophosphoryl diester phosphodiesterase